MRSHELAKMIDHTLLSPEATPERIAGLCDEANALGVAAICISPNRLPVPNGSLDVGIAVATVIGFPTGAHHRDAKAAEAARAVTDGAEEIDVVIDLGLAAAGLWDAVTTDLAAVRAAAPSAVMKVIIESAFLETPDRIVAACRASEAAGADMVKTSTGYHPAGGATVEAVSLMARTVDGRLGVKASGGIRDAATALQMVDAGATRLGCSASRAILEGL